MKIILAITLAIVATANADKITVTLKSGGSMTGTLVGKSATEIKVETTYGVIPLHADRVTPESWTAAQRAAISKPSGNYVVPTPSPKPRKYVEKDPANAEAADGGAISVDDIERAYATNPVAADLRFKGKPIAVRGTINNIGTSEWGRPFVRIGDKVIKHYPWGVEKKIAHLKVGQITTLTGTCYGVTAPDEGSRIVIRESLSYERNPQR